MALQSQLTHSKHEIYFKARMKWVAKSKTKQHIYSLIIIFGLFYYAAKYKTSTRDVPKVMSNFFLHANWEQQTKESAVVDGTSCCVILEWLVTSLACITWRVTLLTKWPTTICRFASVVSSNSLWKRKSLLQNSPETSACLWKCVHGCEQCSKMGETF